MYRLAILFKDGTTEGKNVKTKGEAEDYVLKESEKKEIKRADIKNLDTGKRERVF